MAWYWFMLAVLATYRVAHMVALEDGPWDVFTRLRTWAMLRTPGGTLERGLSCPLCISFWLAFVAAIPLSAGLIGYMFQALAIAGAVVVLYKVVER